MGISNNHRVLVTGGAGFLAHNLIDSLGKTGRYSFVCLDQRPCAFGEGVECVCGSFLDQDLIRRLLAKVDTVVHLGSNALPVNDDYVSDVEQNLLGSIALIKQCEQAGIRQIIYASSGGTVYGPGAPIPTPETAPCRPICSYGIIKAAVEDYLALASRLSGIKTVSLRIANPYGPWQNWNSPQGVAAVMCHRMLTGQPVVIYGDGSVKRDYVYIDDVVEAFRLAMETPVRHSCYNVGSGQPVSLAELTERVASVVGAAPQIERLPSRGCDVPCSCLDISLIGRELGWAPTVALDVGLTRLVDWQRANPSVF